MSATSHLPAQTAEGLPVETLEIIADHLLQTRSFNTFYALFRASQDTHDALLLLASRFYVWKDAQGITWKDLAARFEGKYIQFLLLPDPQTAQRPDPATWPALYLPEETTSRYFKAVLWWSNLEFPFSEDGASSTGIQRQTLPCICVRIHAKAFSCSYEQLRELNEATSMMQWTAAQNAESPSEIDSAIYVRPVLSLDPEDVDSTDATFLGEEEMADFPLCSDSWELRIFRLPLDRQDRLMWILRLIFQVTSALSVNCTLAEFSRGPRPDISVMGCPSLKVAAGILKELSRALMLKSGCIKVEMHIDVELPSDSLLPAFEQVLALFKHVQQSFANAVDDQELWKSMRARYRPIITLQIRLIGQEERYIAAMLAVDYKQKPRSHAVKTTVEMINPGEGDETEKSELFSFSG